MVDAYKAELFSADGSTFIRPYNFYIPRFGYDGVYHDYSTKYYRYTDAVSMITAFATEHFQAFDPEQTMMAIHQDQANQFAAVGFNHTLVLEAVFPNLAVNDSVRWKFKNKNYMLWTIAAHAPAPYESVSLKIEFFLEDDTKVTERTVDLVWIDYGSGGGSGWSDCRCFAMFPFAYRNQYGVFTDTHLRWWTGEIRVGYMNGSYTPNPYNQNGLYLGGNPNPPNDHWLCQGADLIDWIDGLAPIDPDNPYSPGGPSEPGDGTPGNFSDDSDDVEEDVLPSISAVGTGMATIFTPGTLQLKNLSDIFWGANWWQALQNSVEGIDKMFVSLGIVPFIVTPGATVEVTWLGLAWTEVYLTLAAKQYFEFDMGSINLADDPRIFTSNSALDYSPFSKLGIYLPFIGYQELDIDEFRNATVNLVYRVDILSGTCVALIKINGNTIYQFTGNCMTQIPITSQSFENMITNAVNVGIAVSGVRSASAVGSAANGVAEELANKGKASEKQKALTETKSRVHVEGATDRLLSACANSLMGLKPNYDKSGAVSNSASLLAVKQPFLFLTTPRQCIPEHYQRYSGFPSNITMRIGDCTGYLVVESIRLNGLVATSSEVEEIYDLLKSGVIV